MTHNNMELTAPRLDESYITNYQTYMKPKSGYESFLNGSSTPSTETKIVKDNFKNNQCKICAVIGKPSDLPRVLNQGLYYKYTSSQDFFYTKDITSIIEKKRQPASIKYYDDLVYDEAKEHLKAVFKVEESQTLMNEIKQFYSQFYTFARNFQKPYFRILNTNIARHRRIEYIRVFQNNSPRETTRTKYGNTEDNGFNFMPMLGETFLKDNYRETSTFGERPSERRSGFRRETEQYLKEMETNFNKLKNLDRQTNDEEDGVNKLSNAMYNKQYMLYSRNDSETAEELLRNVLHEFKSAEKKARASQKEISVTKIEAYKKDIVREKKRLPSRSRPQSPSSTSVSITKYQSERANILKEIMRDADNGTNEIEYLTERVHAKDLKSTREYLGEEGSHRLTRPESVTNLHQSRNGNGRREPKGTNLIAKFNPGNLKDAIYDRESIMNQVSQLRTSRTKLADYKSEEKKNHTPIEIHYKPTPVYEDGSSTATSKQAKVSYVNSPSGFKSHSSLETLILKKHEEKPSKSPLIRPEVVIPNTYSRETKIVLKRGDSLVGFDSTKSSKSRDSRTGAESATSRKTLKGSKSNPRSLNRQLDREAHYENQPPGDIINLKKAIDSSGYQSVRKPYLDQDIPELAQKIVPQQKHMRSVSSGIKKLRFEGVLESKREDSLRRGNISISGGYQNVSASYRSVGPLAEAQNQIRLREDMRNYECQRIAEIYSQTGPVRKRTKSKSSANILIQPASLSKGDLSGKESKRGSNPEIEAGITQERKKITFRDVKDLMNIWSPKFSKKLATKEKSPVKLQANKVQKHQRYASRG